MGRSLHLRDGSVFLCLDNRVLCSAALTPDNEKEPLTQQFTRILQDFHTAKICPGVDADKYPYVKFCAGSVLEDGVWRSAHCISICSEEMPSCSECYTVKRALGRLNSKPQPVPMEEKLSKLKHDYRMAQQKMDRSGEPIKVKYR